MEERRDVGREEGVGEGRGEKMGGRREERKKEGSGGEIGGKTTYISVQQHEMSKYKYKCPFTATHMVHLIKS